MTQKKEIEQTPKKTNEKVSIYKLIKDYLDEYYNIRFNEIALSFEIKKKEDKNFEPLNENNLLIELTNANYTLSMDKLTIFLRSDYVQKYNPFKEFFTKLKPNPTDAEFLKLCECVKTTDQDFFINQFKKWLVRSVKCATNNAYFNKQCLTFVGGQNAGKTSFFRFLIPQELSHYYAENIDTSKDTRVLLAKNFIINLDELAALNKIEINHLKSYFTKTIINERLPFDKKNSILYRTANFVGSVNRAEFLNDETGSVRWLCFELTDKINWQFYIKNVDIMKVWAYALHLLNNGFECEMTAEEIKQLQEGNKNYQMRTIEMELIEKSFKKGDKKNQDSIFMTATDILNHISTNSLLGQKCNIINIGKALTFLSYEREKYLGQYGYFVINLQTPPKEF